MTPDVATGDPTKLLCLHCARRVVSPKSTTKYGELSRYLRFRGDFTDSVKLPFAKIDGIIGDNLPMSAYRLESWWRNAGSNVYARQWRDAGWEVHEVNVDEGYVVFHKVRDVPLKASSRGKARREEIKKPFTPVHVRFPQAKMPSKTKVSKLYGRIKNVERQRTSMPTYHGSFKPKSMHEKRLFKMDKKLRPD